MRYRPLVLVMFLCAIALSACNGADGSSDAEDSAPSVTPTSPPPSTEASPSPSTTSASGCENEREATKSHLRRGRLAGDLDADGSDEVIRLAVDESGAQGCQAFIVVQSSSLDDITPIDDPNLSFDLGLPALDSAKPIGFGPGDEVVLVLSAGASTQFFGMASVVDGDLVQVTIEDGPYGDVFPYGGSVGHLEASDCAQPSEELNVSTIVISSATTEGKRYRLERRFFGIEDGAELLPEPESTERKVVSFDELVSYPEFGEAPFAHCG